MATKKTVKTGKAEGRKTTKQTVKGRQTVKAAETAKLLRVKPNDKAFTGARAAWYGALQAHDGKPSEAFIEACTAKPPVLTKSGKAEDPRGWLRYFVRAGVAQVEG